MLRHLPPRHHQPAGKENEREALMVILTEEENEAAIERLFALTAKANPTDEEQDLIDRLTAAIEQFEERWYPL
jgi:AmiR/NasT family two-component response regulator